MPQTPDQLWAIADPILDDADLIEGDLCRLIEQLRRYDWAAARQFAESIEALARDIITALQAAEPKEQHPEGSSSQ